MPTVYGEMLRQIAVDYPGLPDAREITLSQIRWFYEGCRKALYEYTKPKAKK